MSARHNARARTKRDDELVSNYIRLWGDAVDYGKKHQDAKAIVRLLDKIRSKSIAIEEARERDHLKEDEDEEAEELGARLDDADEVVDGLKEGMEGNLPPEETAQASQASSSLTKKRKRGADRRPRNTAYKARVAGERGSLLRHAQSAASLSSASGAENALAKSHTRLGYRQTLRYFGVGY
ncbi:hypothetical protein NBRC10512_002493 [Rhodotorula toruloides]